MLIYSTHKRIWVRSSLAQTLTMINLKSNLGKCSKPIQIPECWHKSICNSVSSRIVSATSLTHPNTFWQQWVPISMLDFGCCMCNLLPKQWVHYLCINLWRFSSSKRITMPGKCIKNMIVFCHIKHELIHPFDIWWVVDSENIWNLFIVFVSFVADFEQFNKVNSVLIWSDISCDTMFPSNLKTNIVWVIQ